MTLSVILGYLIAVVSGLIGGFFITNKNRHANEFRLGTIIFIIVCLIWIATGDLKIALSGVLHLGILWLLLGIGIYIGEWTHSKVVQHFMASLKKKDIEYGITELVHMGHRVYYMRRSIDVDRFCVQKEHVLTCLEELKRKSENIRRHDIARQVDNVAELVVEYTDLVQVMAGQEEGIINGRCAEIGDNLLEVTNYTLSYAEYVLRGSITNRFTVGVFL